MFFAQRSEFNKLKEQFESFEYQKVIDSANKLIMSGNLSDSLLTKVYEIQAISYYSIGDEASSRRSFEQLIKLDKNYAPDPAKISPKVISFFNDVKSSVVAQPSNNETVHDSLSVRKNPIGLKQEFNYRGSMIKNIFLPGWGQMSSSQFVKGAIISGVSLGLLGGMIHYIIDTNRKEDDYLSETDNTLINAKYNAYNDSYKTRNIFIISYIAVWVYSQIDILLLDNPPQEAADNQSNASFSIAPYNGVQFSFRVPF